MLTEIKRVVLVCDECGVVMLEFLIPAGVALVQNAEQALCKECEARRSMYPALKVVSDV